MEHKLSVKRIALLFLIGLKITFIVCILFYRIDFFAGLNDLLFDQFISFRGEQSPAENVVLVVVDDESLYKFGNTIPRNQNTNGIPRNLYAKLIRMLSAVGAKTIVFDVLFQDATKPEIDTQLASATAAAGNVVHSFKFSTESESEYLHHENFEKYAIPVESDESLNLIEGLFATFPHQNFNTAFHQGGYFNAELDPDGLIRRIPVFMKYDGLIYPALGLSAILNFYNVTTPVCKIERNFWGNKVVIESDAGILHIPVNEKGQVLLNLYGLLSQFETHTLHRVIELSDVIENSEASSLLHDWFAGKTVLIGLAVTINDEHPTPFTSKFYGIGFHATLISNIMQNDSVKEVPWYIDIIISVILIVLILSAFYYYFHASKSTWMFYVLSSSIFLIFNLFAYELFLNYLNTWLRIVPINAVFIIYFITLILYDKNVRVKELNHKISLIRDSIYKKLVDLDKVDLRINSQTEQFKIIHYFANELQAILQNSSLNQHPSLEKNLPAFFENQEIIKENLIKEIDKLKAEKAKINQEREKLELERNIYEKLVKGEDREKPQAVSEESHINIVRIAQEIMSAYDYFQTHKKKFDYSTFNIIALSSVLTTSGESQKTQMGDIFDKIKLMRGFDSTVLVTGEHGTGKELIARAIHNHSKRSHKRFVTVNCAAIPENLLESELFGHEKGAFTNAVSSREGAFEYANGGTIFLDEIGELKLALQAKLLRVLQEKDIQKIGSNKSIHVDVRVIAATNRNLEQAIAANEFREDLYFRLNVVNLHLPPLRNRKNDIPFLIHYFLNQFNATYNSHKSFSGEAMLAAMCNEWPGNIRMLQHFVEKMCVTTSEDVIRLQNVPDDVQDAYRNIFESPEVPWLNEVEKIVHNEKNRVLDIHKTALKEHQGDEFEAAKVRLDSDANCYDYFNEFVNEFASVFPANEREILVRKIIVDMQDQLFKWCRDEKIAKLGELYDLIEKILGRSRRQIDNWRKELGDF